MCDVSLCYFPSSWFLKQCEIVYCPDSWNIFVSIMVITNLLHAQIDNSNHWGNRFWIFLLFYEVCHLYLLEIFVIWGVWEGFCFVFAKCNMKAHAAALVCYADLVKKNFYIYCLLSMLLWNFFLKLLCNWSVVKIWRLIWKSFHWKINVIGNKRRMQLVKNFVERITRLNCWKQ